MKNFITLKTESQTVIINKDHIVSIEIEKIKESIDCDNEKLEADFLQVTIITTKHIYTDNNLYTELSEIEYI